MLMTLRRIFRLSSFLILLKEMRSQLFFSKRIHIHLCNTYLLCFYSVWQGLVQKQARINLVSKKLNSNMRELIKTQVDIKYKVRY